MDTTPYLDVPFVPGGRALDGADCWGLVRLVSAREFGRELPAYPGAGVRDGGLDLRSLGAEAAERRDADFDPVEDPEPGDVVLLRPRRRPIHVGIIVAKRPLTMLHAERGVGTVVERVYGTVWRHRVEGFYRYRGDPA